MNSISKKRKHLIFAPHHDDEVIGCGGTIAKAMQSGDQSRLIVVTKGSFTSPNMEEKEQVELREKECLESCKILGIQETIFLREEDRSFSYSKSLLNKFIESLIDYCPDFIYFPHDNESDRDHRLVNELVSEAILQSFSFYNTKLAKSIYCLQYEVWTPLQSYQVIKDITKVANVKFNALKEYKSQNDRINLTKGINGLNAYRGMQTGKSLAEVFKVEYR